MTDCAKPVGVHSNDMTVTLIAAHSENGVIAKGGRLPWHLPDEIAHFRAYCQGKWLLVGRRTWDEMQGWFRPGQTPVVVTRNESLRVPDGYAAGSVEEGLALAEQHGADECVVIGGGEIFAAAMRYADILLLTEVHTTLDGDVHFPPVPAGDWQEKEHHHHPADATHAFAFTIRRFVRRHSSSN
jgi:dihydrofolate reductase